MTSATINNCVSSWSKGWLCPSKVNFWHGCETTIRQLIFLKAEDCKNTIARVGENWSWFPWQQKSYVVETGTHKKIYVCYIKWRKMENKQQGTDIHQKFPTRGANHGDSSSGSQYQICSQLEIQAWLLQSTNASAVMVPLCVNVGWTLCHLGIFCSKLSWTY